MASTELNLLVNSRKYLRKIITENFNSKDNFATLSEIDKKTKKAILIDKFDDLKVHNSKIQSLKFSEETDERLLENEFKICEEYNYKVKSCISLLESQNTGLTRENVVDARSLLRSPIAPLPVFGSGENENFDMFVSEFEDTISKFRYSDYDKLLLLKQQVKGRAAILLTSLEFSNHTYDEAKKLLTDALASPVIRKNNLIKQLSQIKLNYNDEPFEFISKLRNIFEALKKLKVNIEDFICFFAWQGLNDSFKTHLVNITGNTRPELKDILDNFFDACDRYRETQSRFKRNESKVQNKVDSEKTSFAANIKYETKNMYKKCSLCGPNADSDHSISQCSKFLTPEQKIIQIEKLKGCVRCGYMNHNTESCRFKFNSRCQRCRDWHMTFLCNSKTDKEKNGKSKTKNENVVKRKEETKTEVSSNTICVATTVLNCNLNEGIILPTFVCKVNDFDIRGLRDGGYQTNLITEGIAKQFNFNVIKSNVNILVNGINGSQNYQSKLVEATFKFGSKNFILRAFTLPEIKIHLRLDGLTKIANEFSQRGHKLADKNLLNNTDEICDINFILGSCSGYCLPENKIIFGNEIRKYMHY